MATSKSGGYGFTITGTGSGEVSGARVFQVVVNGLPNCIHFKHASGAATFANVAITGNQFLLQSASGSSSGIFCNKRSRKSSRISNQWGFTKHELVLEDAGAGPPCPLNRKAGLTAGRSRYPTWAPTSESSHGTATST